MEVLEFPNGVCPKHGPRLSVNNVPQCLRCNAEAERAAKGPGPVVNVEDPGHAAMGSIPGGASPVNLTRPGVVTPKVTVTEGIPVNKVSLLEIREAIYRLPMPKSLKQYKRFQKIQQLIEQAVEDENGEAD